MRITYFASDLSDPAMVRRVQILLKAGVDLTVIGFRRCPEAIDSIAGVPAIDLGQTFDGHLGLRLLQVMRQALHVPRLQAAMADADVVIGRNLEMVTLANIARTWARANVPLVYECLDINAAFVQGTAKTKLLRRWDGYMLARCSALIISAPNFIPMYFSQLGVPVPPVVAVAENKRMVADPGSDRSTTYAGGQPPWRIGWFGKLRCDRSFHILLNLAKRYPTLVEIIMAGQPIKSIPSLVEQHLPLPNMRWLGVYTQDELGTLYNQCDLTWAIEYFGEGSNSDWSLPNRIYEGGYYNVPSIALSATATADWLRERNTGLLIDSHEDLPAVIENLTPERYAELRQSAATIPLDDVAWTAEACRAFVAQLVGPARFVTAPQQGWADNLT